MGSVIVLLTLILPQQHIYVFYLSKRKTGRIISEFSNDGADTVLYLSSDLTVEDINNMSAITIERTEFAGLSNINFLVELMKRKGSSLLANKLEM